MPIVLPDDDAIVISTGKTLTVQFPGWDPCPPIGPGCYSPACVVVQNFIADLGRNYKIKRVSCFLGFNKGDEFEAAIEIMAGDGTRLYAVSEHKEAGLVRYDAWDHDKDYEPAFKTSRLLISLRAQNSHVTQAGQPHFEVKLWVE